MPYHPMKKHMEKLDEWGAGATKKFSATRDAASGSSSKSFSERFNDVRGKDDRWERTKAPAPRTGDETNIVPQSSSRAATIPQAPRPAISAGSKVPPPPPPSRVAGGSAAVPAPPARGKPAPPPLPRRMDNEAGIDRPPPSYGNAVAAPSPSAELDHIEFSRFTEEDKQAFFALLDEFFASRSASSVSAGKLASRSDSAAPSTNDTHFHQAKVTKEAPKPSGPGAKASIFPQANGSGSSKTATGSKSGGMTYPLLSASAQNSYELCTALTCATFLCYPDSYPEWSGAQPWFTKPNAVPKSLEGRNDVARSSSWMYSGNSYTLLGCARFADLSDLFWKITWDSTQPAASVRSQVAYREPPKTWNDEERLMQAGKGFGDWIAGYAETNMANRTPVGDGECWSLAAEAIKYTNQTAQLSESNRLMTTIGRTHGFLIFAGKVDEGRGQSGRWRGGDRIRSHGGGVRRGDIVEWRTAKCAIQGRGPGAYATLGAPDHTAIIVEDSPAPERLSYRSTKDASNDLYSVLGVSRSATQAEIRAAYLRGARQHHPDKQSVGPGSGDSTIQRLNEAHATLSNATLRAKYDEQLRGQGTTSNSSRVTAEIDLDSFEVVESEESSEQDSMTFFYPCRCGTGFYISDLQLQNGQKVIACSGCSEQIRVLWQDEEAAAWSSGQSKSVDDEESDEQPELLPSELGSITVIEQSAGKVPTRCTYDLKGFTAGEMWIYRPVWEAEYLGGPIAPTWPPSLPGWEQLA